MKILNWKDVSWAEFLWLCKVAREVNEGWSLQNDPEVNDAEAQYVEILPAGRIYFKNGMAMQHWAGIVGIVAVTKAEIVENTKLIN